MFNRPINQTEEAPATRAPATNDTEQAILDAAERLFLEKGFARTSTTEIARAAGCNQALIHYYFRTKDNLFESIFERKVRLILGNVQQIQETRRSFEERMAQRIEAHFDIIAANPAIPALVFSELLTNPERIRSLRARIGDLPLTMFGTWQKELDAEIRKGTIRPVALIDLLLSILSLNVAPFLVGPILKNAIALPEDEYRELLRRRKTENVRTILASLRPDPAEKSSRPERAAAAATKRRRS